MMKALKSKSRLLLFALLTIFSLLLLGAAEIDTSMRSASSIEEEAIVKNLTECNTHLYQDSDAGWREVLHKKPLFMLRIEASVR